jgi:hypothetical protein
MNKRWPIHPPPHLNESLLSWIMRIASLYVMQPEEFLLHEFGINLEWHDLYSIDLNPSPHLLNQLSERTGIEFDAIRALTAQSYVPLLIDNLEGNETNAYSDYMSQFPVFFYKKQSMDKHNNSWIPWFNINRFTTIHGCEACLSQDPEPYLRLYWRFPWMISCPIHKLLLKQVRFYVYLNQQAVFFFNNDNNQNIEHNLNNLYAMDNITLQAVTNGFIELPSGKLHGGVWLRILRTLIEELTFPLRMFSSQTRKLIELCWQDLNFSIRRGFGAYNLFERLDYRKQLTLMLVAASVFKSILSKEGKLTGTVANMLTELPPYKKDLLSVYPEAIKPKTLLDRQIENRQIEGSSYTSAFEKANKSLEELVVIMRSDPKAVESFRNLLKAFDASNTRLVKVDECLKELGIEVPST